MLGYLLRRILAAIPVMGVVALFVFLLLRLTPGDPAATILQATLWGLGINTLLMGEGEPEVKELIDRVAKQMGLKAPARRPSSSRRRSRR